MTQPLYLLETALISPLGADSPSTMAAVSAGVSAYSLTDYTDATGNPLVMSLIPDEAMPDLSYAFHRMPFISARLAVMVRSFHAAFLQLEPALSQLGPVPLFLSVPPDLGQGYEERWLSLLGTQHPGILEHISFCKLFHSGRTGSLEALQAARSWLAEKPSGVCVVAGLESFRDSVLLKGLVKRLKSEQVSDGFVPGEGSCLLLIAARPKANVDERPISFGDVGVTSEPGHMGSDQATLGDGLSAAAATSLQTMQQTTQKCAEWYSSANGERYWAKELGVAHIRNADKFHSECEHLHPADCLGDTGAATGCYLIAFAAHNLRKKQSTHKALITCSSDQESRAAVTVSCEEIVQSLSQEELA